MKVLLHELRRSNSMSSSLFSDCNVTDCLLKDLLGMKVLRHEEFDSGCPATCNGPYNNLWSKTMIGYGPEDANFVEAEITKPVLDRKQTTAATVRRRVARNQRFGERVIEVGHQHGRAW